LRTLVASHCVLEPLVVAHAREMFDVLSDPAIYEFENAPPKSLGWLTERYAVLERRGSADGAQQWLNWAIRLPGGELAGYVQATVEPSGTCYVAYELTSRYWRRGIGRSAVRAMLDELASAYDARQFVAVLKSANHRSWGLLANLGFRPADAQEAARFSPESDERVMLKAVEP